MLGEREEEDWIQEETLTQCFLNRFGASAARGCRAQLGRGSEDLSKRL